MKLIFVYNANSGPANTLLDIGHKILRPETYACNLCAMTHGVFRERAEWRAFREASPLDFEFLHKDEFEARYEPRFAYPVVLLDDGELQLVLDASAINQCKDVSDLIAVLSSLSSDSAPPSGKPEVTES